MIEHFPSTLETLDSILKTEEKKQLKISKKKKYIVNIDYCTNYFLFHFNYILTCDLWSMIFGGHYTQTLTERHWTSSSSSFSHSCDYEKGFLYEATASF